MNHTTTIAIIRIIIAIALAVSMVVAGASLSSVLLKQQKGYAAPQTKKQEQNTIQGLHGNLATKRAAGQHANQENQCLRSGKCNNSNVGEQTLGNDNSVTGFSDQSKNIQNRIVVTPTPTPSTLTQPIPILIIRKDCIPIASCLGVKFSLTITGNNPQPSSVSADIQHNPQLVRLGPGNFTITETPVAGFTLPRFIGDCTQTGSNSATGTMPPKPPEGSIECDITNHPPVLVL